MSRFFPHAPYAEDQPLARTILWTHVLTRAATVGSIVGVGVSSAQEASRRPSPSKVSLPGGAATLTQLGASASRPAMFPRFCRTAGTSAIATMGIVTLGTMFKMWGREEVEWQDRSWRLMANSGQLKVDDWTYSGMLAAIVVAGANGRLKGAGPRGVVGVAGLGGVAGTVGYLGWLVSGRISQG